MIDYLQIYLHTFVGIKIFKLCFPKYIYVTKVFRNFLNSCNGAWGFLSNLCNALLYLFLSEISIDKKLEKSNKKLTKDKYANSFL